jgi:hypothetical protein
MLFKILVILHTLLATVRTGGHLVLAVTVLSQALKNLAPERVHQFEEHFEGQAIVYGYRLYSQLLRM